MEGLACQSHSVINGEMPDSVDGVKGVDEAKSELQVSHGFYSRNPYAEPVPQL